MRWWRVLDPVVDEDVVVAGRYRLLAHVGSGGMGVVWRARDEWLRRSVAIKCARVGDPQGVERLRQEAAIAARFDSPHIVTVHDLLVEHGTWWLVMEYVESRSLKQIVTHAEHRPTPEWVAWIGWQIAEALREVHAHHVVHGDVTPENILVTADGFGKLADFGISRALGAEGTVEPSGNLWGKPRYLAPEVVRGRGAGRASDIFSLGASLFTALEGHGPYGADNTPGTLLRRALDGDLERPVASGELTKLLRELLRVRPVRRPGPEDAARRLRALAPADGRGLVTPSATPAASVGSAATPVPPPRTAVTSSVLRPGGRWPWFPLLPALRQHARRPSRRWALGIVASAGVTTGVLIGISILEPQSPAARAVVGDERAVDPCALLDPASLSRFGEGRLDPARGGFPRCDLIVHDAAGQQIVDAEVTFRKGPQRVEDQLSTRRVGDITVLEGAAGGRECERALLLPDGYAVKISIKRLAENTRPDLAAIADAVAGHASDVLGRDPAPQRTSAPRQASLFGRDACEMLDPAVLARVPGLDARNRNTDFGRWRCLWPRSAGREAVELRFYQREPLGPDAGDPRRLAGRQAFVTPGVADDECTVQVLHRTYTEGLVRPIVELVQIKVYGPESKDLLCGRAEELGTASVANLPPP